MAGIARLAPAGKPEEMYRSLTQVLGKLDPGTLLYPGHKYARAVTSTLGLEREQNPYYRVSGLEEFLDLRMGRRS